MIDNRAIIDPSAKISEGVEIGPYAIIGPDVEIGPKTYVGSHAVIHKNTKIGSDNRIESFASVGADPQHRHYQGETTYLEIGNHNTIREFCTLNRGTVEGGGVTRIGNNNLFMAYVHIAHDCIIGNEIVFSNSTALAGHVMVADYVVFGGLCGVHQFVNIGAYSFFGGMSRVAQDVPPYLMVVGNPAVPKGLNTVGLQRRGFTAETLRTLKRAYSVVYRQELRLQDAINQLLPMVETCAELKPFIDMLQNSQRGITR